MFFNRSGLCAVYSLTPGQTPCCLAVSPEGVVRYWPSIVHEGSSTETSTELGGQVNNNKFYIIKFFTTHYA